MGEDKKIAYSIPGMTPLDVLKRDKKAVALEFEALLIKEMLKEAFKPMLEGKSFDTRLYYDTFLEKLSKKMADAGGIGIARFILENLKDGKT
ncbi:MAG: rod-binding protein [Aquificaceae bacterium]